MKGSYWNIYGPFLLTNEVREISGSLEDFRASELTQSILHRNLLRFEYDGVIRKLGACSDVEYFLFHETLMYTSHK